MAFLTGAEASTNALERAGWEQHWSVALHRPMFYHPRLPGRTVTSTEAIRYQVLWNQEREQLKYRGHFMWGREIAGALGGVEL